MTQDSSVALYPYFKIHSGKLPEFKGLVERFVEKTQPEQGCLYYMFTFDGDIAHCREAYVNADALLKHVENVGALIQEALTMSDVHRMEVHGPAAELEKLRELLTPLNAQFFILDRGILR